MNAPIDENGEPTEPEQLEYVLHALHQGIRGLSVNAAHTVSIVYGCDSEYPEEINQYHYASAFLSDHKIIDGYKVLSSGQKKTQTDERDKYHGTYRTSALYTFEYTLKPKVLMRYLIETSRIPKYELKLDEGGRLILNDTHVLARPQFNSPNRYFIDLLIKRPKGIITQDELVAKIGKKQCPRFHSILDNLNIAPNLTKIFFLRVGKDMAEFRNNVTAKDLAGLKINEREIDKFIKKLPRVR